MRHTSRNEAPYYLKLSVPTLSTCFVDIVVKNIVIGLKRWTTLIKKTFIISPHLAQNMFLRLMCSQIWHITCLNPKPYNTITRGPTVILPFAHKMHHHQRTYLRPPFTPPVFRLPRLALLLGLHNLRSHHHHRWWNFCWTGSCQCH